MKALITYEGYVHSWMPDVYANDMTQIFTFTVKQKSDAVVNLTGSTVLLKVKEVNATVNKITGTCVLTTPASGICTYTTVSGDLNTPGVYDAELQVTNGTAITTAYLGRFRMLQDLPN